MNSKVFPLQKPNLAKRSISIPSENVRQAMEVQKWNNGLKWVKCS